jgi:hypothetical protein
MKSHYSVWWAVFLAIFPRPATLACADSSGKNIVHVFVDVRDGAWYKIDGPLPVMNEGSPTVHGWQRVRGPKAEISTARKIVVGALGTNTAWYDHAITAAPVVGVEKETLFSYLRELRPYLTDVPKELVDGDAAPRAKKDPAVDLVPLLERLDTLIFGAQGLHDIHYQVLKALRNTEPKKIRTAIEGAASGRAGALDRDWFDGTSSQKRLSIVGQLIATYDTLQARVVQYRGAEDDAVLAASRALRESEKVMRSAYELERMASIAAHASSRWTSRDTLHVAWSHGLDVALTVTPRDSEHLSQLAELKAREYSIRIVPWWPLRPSLGVSLFYADAASFGQTDARFGYGLNLGLAPAGLHQIKDGPLSLWLAELTVAPESKQRSIGIGSAISYGVLKLGCGWIWIKHEEEDRETYGKGLWYFSISLFGIPPFTD